MKKILLTFITLLFFGGVYSQDTLQDSVYKKVNQIREQSNLDTLSSETYLELASAQHACWLALFNLKTDTLILTSEEQVKSTMAQSIKTPSDRVKNYSDKYFTEVKESITVFYEKPSTDAVLSFMKDKLNNNRFKYQGFWIIKFETKNGVPIWYLVYLLTD
jgi:hypothetical protein